MPMQRKTRCIRPRFCVFRGYNWCGPGCSGPGAPINAVDIACKAHDICYKSGGSKCKCDQEFLCSLHPLINLHTQEGRHARTIYYYMKIQSRFTC